MVRRTLALLAALFAVMIATAALGTTPAHAGGPTSVLLSAPPHVIAFGYEDPAYGELQRVTGNGGSTSAGSAGDVEEHASGHFVRATWLIHDMSVWRIDIIYPDAPGGPWIATTESLTTGSMPETPTWHVATDGAALRKVLGSLKLLHGQGGPTTLDYLPAPASEPSAEQSAAVQPSAAAQPPATAQAASTFTGWRWTIPGFLVGATAALLAIRLLPKRRWELIDAE